MWRFPLEYIGELVPLQQFVKTRSSDASYCLHTTCGERKKRGKHLPSSTHNTLPEANSSPLKMDGWKATFLLERPIFRGD